MSVCVCVHVKKKDLSECLYMRVHALIINTCSVVSFGRCILSYCIISPLGVGPRADQCHVSVVYDPPQCVCCSYVV